MSFHLDGRTVFASHIPFSSMQQHLKTLSCWSIDRVCPRAWFRVYTYTPCIQLYPFAAAAAAAASPSPSRRSDRHTSFFVLRSSSVVRTPNCFILEYLATTYMQLVVVHEIVLSFPWVG